MYERLRRLRGDTMIIGQAKLHELINKYGSEASVYDVLIAEVNRLTESNKSQRKDLKKMRRTIYQIKRGK